MWAVREANCEIEKGSRPQTTPLLYMPCVGEVLERRRAGDDLDDLARDARLTDAVHIERQRADQFAGVLRGGIHRRHARALFRSY